MLKHQALLLLFASSLPVSALNMNMKGQTTSARRGFLQVCVGVGVGVQQQLSVPAAAAAVATDDEEEQVEVYFGCGCFWHVQHGKPPTHARGGM